PWSLPRDWGRVLGAAVLAAVAGGQLYALAASRILEPSAGSERVPSTAELGLEARTLEQQFRQVSLPAWRVPDSEHGQLQDVALALWRQSPLARRGVLSALTVERAGRALSSFAFGLPMTKSARLDSNPSRLQELRLPGWDDTLIEGEGILDGLGAGVRLRYWALLRPGFRTGGPLTPDLAVGLVRGPPDAGRLATAAGRFSAATEAAELRPRPWSAPLRRLEPLLARQDLGRGLGLAGRVLVAAAGVAAVLLLLTVPAARIRQILDRAWSSYSQRLVAVFALLVLATLIPLQTVLVGMVSRRMDAEQLQRGMAALESTQRVLGEYVDSLPPGFGVQTTLDDELLSWLARVIHHEVNLYWDSSVYASSRRELFTAGLLPVRIPGEIYADLALSGAPVSFRRNRVGETSYLEIYAPLRVPGLPSQEKLFLAIPLLAQQEAVAAEVETLRRRTLLTAGALFLILLAVGTTLARSFSGPLRAMADGTRRIAGGAERLDLKPGFRELATLARAIDDMAHRIGEGRRRLLSEKQLVDRVVDSVTSAVVSLDGRGRVLLCNRVARELLGVEPGGDLRRALSGRQEMRPVLEALEAAPGAPLARTVRLPPAQVDADEREWAIVVTPLPHGDEPSTLLVVEDITEVLRGQRLQAWAEMARIIAHEIKNPLTPIRLSAEHLRGVYEADPQGVGRVLERCTDNILSQVEELRQIAGEFATFSQIPRLERQEADLVDLVRETVAAYETGGASAPWIRVTTAPSACRLDLDTRLVGRALRNLLENALRATGPAGRVEVRVETGEDAVSVVVADSGPGVPAEMLARIFDPYFSTREGGTGLGLQISRRIAEEHGGSLAARNHSHLGGLEVELRLPRIPVTSRMEAGSL
ncbi:MAG: ATP-binding protein, partial [Thermoanaerobaculia bacterium]